MANIFILTDDAILYIMQYLDTKDKIALAYTCQTLRQICINGRALRKVDLSTHLISRTQGGALLNRFFRDKQMAEHVRELNLSNHRVLNWQMDDHLEELIISICPHLEALHILSCEMSLQTLHHILQQAPKLTALSWSLMDLTPEDTQFLLKSIESSDQICSTNIKRFHLETFPSLPYIQIVKYLVLSCSKYLEELEIYIWKIYETYGTGLSFPLAADQMIPPTSVADMLQNLHSLTVVSVEGRTRPGLVQHYDPIFEAELSDFIFTILSKKSRKTKWKKLWIEPPIGISRLQDLFHLTDISVPLHEEYPHALHSVEAITARAGPSLDSVVDLKTLFQRIDDNTIRSLLLCQPRSRTISILELCEPILSVGGHALKFFSLFVNPRYGIDAGNNVVLHTLFSNCSNITELDLLGCYFEKDICEPLSKLKHLTKVQLMQCAISSKHHSENQAEISKANLLTFVENCKMINHFDVRGCGYYHMQLSCRLTDDDLLTLAKLKNLKSLTLYKIFRLSKWAFLQNISEHCNFLTMLRISATKKFHSCCMLNLMVCAKFLKHLAVDIPWLDLGLESFWNLLSHARNLERLCIRSSFKGCLNVSGAVEMFKSLPRLHVLHLHCYHMHKGFHDLMIRMLEEEKSGRRFFFELITEYFGFMPPKIWISNQVLPLNIVELCEMSPILTIPRNNVNMSSSSVYNSQFV